MHQFPTCTQSQGKHIHGHDYKIEITCSGDVDSKSGLLIDRDQMNSIVHDAIIKKYDKTLLNNYFTNPTGEILCYAIFKELSGTALSPFLHEIKIQETPKNSFSFKVTHQGRDKKF